MKTRNYLSPFLITIIFFIVYSTRIYTQPLTTDANTLLLLHFDNSLNGDAGETPLNSANISYGAGKIGNALSIASNTTLRFDTTQNLNPRQGTIEFWIKPSSEGVAVDMGIGGGLSTQVGYWTRMIFNIYGINGNPENGVIGNNTIWKPNTWYHLAFTWENKVARIYYNGSQAFETNIGFDFPNINLSYFNIGSTINGSSQLQGLMDELRISNRARTAQEICQTYLSGQNLGIVTNLSVRNPNIISLYKTWKLYLQKPGFWKVPSVYTLNGTDTVNLSNTCIEWSVVNTSVADLVNGVITAKSAGTTSLKGIFGGQIVTIPLTVIEPVRTLEYETNIDPFLKTPATCNVITIPVVAIIFIPTLDGINVNTAETDVIPIPQQTITELKKQVLRINLHTKFSLEEGSKFRGYSNSNAIPYLGYKIIDYIYVYEPVPRGFPDPGSSGVFFSDYDQIIRRFDGQNYVDNLGVKEFWVFGYQYKEVSGSESNMSSPTTGDISNSYRFQDDMPVYSKTYITYNYNITRGGNEATHNHGHQIESMCDYVARKQDGNPNMFWQNFVGKAGNNPPLGRCGDTHHPANSNIDYDYHNTTFVASDIKNWKPSGGTTALVNKDTWGSIPYNWPAALLPSMVPNAESNWYIFWMQSIPGNGNQIPYNTTNTKWMTNWWRFMADWDSTTVKIGLYQNTQETNANSGCVLTAVNNLIDHEGLKIFPNPAKDILYYASKNEYNQYKIINSTGQIVMEGNSRNKMINVKQLKPGLHYLQFYKKGYIESRVFIKQ